MNQEKDISHGFAVIGDIEKPHHQENKDDVQLYGTTSLQCKPPVY